MVPRLVFATLTEGSSLEAYDLTNSFRACGCGELRTDQWISSLELSLNPRYERVALFSREDLRKYARTMPIWIGLAAG
jgi:hypothetical protein